MKYLCRIMLCVFVTHSLKIKAHVRIHSRLRFMYAERCVFAYNLRYITCIMHLILMLMIQYGIEVVH